MCNGGVFARGCVAAAALVASAGWCMAQPADTGRGRDLATRLCIQCHVVDRQPSGTVRTDIPSFASMANRNGVSAEFLAGRIIVPHPAMPDIALTAAEIRDVVAYILSLK